MEEIEEPSHKSKKKWLWGGMGLLLIVSLTIGIYFSGVVSFFAYDPIIQIPTLNELTKEEALKELLNAGFDENNITFKEELSDDVKVGFVFQCNPSEGSSVKKSQEIVITISKGNYFVLEDYKGKEMDEVKEKIREALPMATISIESVATADAKPGVILSQSGATVGEKLSPEKSITLFFQVAKAPSVTISGIIGMPVEQALKQLDEAGVAVVSMQRSTIGMSDEEIAALEKGVVVEVDPPEGTQYVQDGSSNCITLYYY